jgi:hypothetical protein
MAIDGQIDCQTSQVDGNDDITGRRRPTSADLEPIAADQIRWLSQLRTGLFEVIAFQSIAAQ